jgi:hypothetical protein
VGASGARQAYQVAIGGTPVGERFRGRRSSADPLPPTTWAIGRATVDGSVAKTIPGITRTELIVIDLCRQRDDAEQRPGVAWLDGDRPSRYAS